MIRSSIQIAGLAFALMMPSTGVQAPGSIEGTVVANGSSTPVPRAMVTLETAGGREVATATATLDGRFVLPNVAPGEYRISAWRDGFVSGARGSQVTVVSGRNTDVSLGVVAEGVISGRVVDWDGLPMVGIQVQALTFIQDDRGRRILIPLRSAETNDLGEYRLYWLPPNSYFVRADPGDYRMRTKEALVQPRRPPSTPTPQQFVSTYFPDVTDAAGAKRFDLRGGETITGTDIRLAEVRKHQVSGVVSIPSSGVLADVRLTPRNPASGISDFSTSTDRDGFFEFDNVIPGSYLLTADTINAAREATFGRVAIEVGNRDIENIAVSLTPGFDLRIRLTIEGRLRRSDDPQLVVNLRPAIPTTPFPTVERNGEDELTMHHFMVGDYSVAVLSLINSRGPNGTPLNGRLYLKSAQYGGADVLTTSLHIEGPPSGILDIAMADGAETLSGLVQGDQKQPVNGATVVLIPEPRLRGRSDLYKSAMTDASGKFEISGITPGIYKAFSWEAVGQGAWLYTDFMELYEDRGQSVRIDSGKRDPISIQLIPSR